uniref:G-protein coupled receptors family 1 profile domain-containing protein n=1 Tax=Arion vulgaris TaxID=1028688 RepID=A0A0B7AEK0_9EUPU
MGWHTNITDISDIDHHLMSSALLPAIVYTAVLMIVGTVGNLLVLIVYRRNFLKSVTRMFIYALAVLDLGNCLVTMPAELAILIRFTSFPDPIWCKVTRYLTYIFNGTSSFILIAIALDRYFKVCRPMRVYITVRKAKIICVTAFCICATLAIPALIIYGELKLRILLSDKGITLYPMEYDLSVINTNTRPGSQPVKRATTLREHTDGFSDDVLTGSFCLLNSKYLNSPVSIIFFIGTCVMYISMVIVVVIFYGKVARAMFILTSKHTRMYSLYNYKNCTPSTNTAFGDVSIARMQRSVDRTNDEVEAEDQQKNQNGNALVCSQKVDEKVCIAETRNKLLKKSV